MNVAIDQDACIGCGICADLCSDTFAMGQDNKAHVLHEPDRSHEACTVEAVRDCPSDAIVVH